MNLVVNSYYADNERHLRGGRILNIRLMQISLLVLALIFVIAPSEPVRAAEFTQGENADCKIQMRGPILKGDLDKFKEAERKYHEAEIFESSAENTICLDSPGG